MSLDHKFWNKYTAPAVQLETIEDLAPKELEAVLAHEVLHCALGHHCRRGERDPKLWNEAADLAINSILVANGGSASFV